MELRESSAPLSGDPCPRAKWIRLFSAETARRGNYAPSGHPMGEIAKLARDSSLGQQNGMMLPRMGPNQQLGGLKAVGISHLMRHCGIGVVKWIRQFSQCRPITGELSRRCFYMVGEKPPTMLPRASLDATASDRFNLFASTPRSCGAQPWNKWGKAG